MGELSGGCVGVFVGDGEAGDHRATLYSLVSTCEARDIDPVDYLKDVLTRVDTHPASRIDELLPHKWSPQHRFVDTALGLPHSARPVAAGWRGADERRVDFRRRRRAAAADDEKREQSHDEHARHWLPPWGLLLRRARAVFPSRRGEVPRHRGR
jgi:hypothetical protein